MQNTWPFTTTYKNQSQGMKFISDWDVQEKWKMLATKFQYAKTCYWSSFTCNSSGILHNFSTWNQKSEPKIYLVPFYVVERVLISFKLIYDLFVCYFLNLKIIPETHEEFMVVLHRFTYLQDYQTFLKTVNWIITAESEKRKPK